MSRIVQVFISYASENIEQVKNLYDGLKKRNVKVWFDKRDLKPGKWKPQITRAIAQSSYFLICLSKAALIKTGDEPGFQDVELNTAFDIALAQSEPTFTIVPARLEEVDRGDNRLSIYQQYDLFTDWEGALDDLAILFGGSPLGSISKKIDERTEDEKIIAALRGKADALYNSGYSERALIFLHTVEELEGETLFSLVTKGAALHTLGNFEQALSAFDKAISLLPDDKTKLSSEVSVVFTNRGKALRDLGSYEEALAAYNVSLSLQPNNYNAWEEKANVFLALWDKQNALEAIDMALSIKPDHAEAHAMRSIVLQCLERYPEALSASERAIELKPNLVQALIDKGKALIAMNNPKGALESIEKALLIEPNNVVALTEKGISLGLQKRYVDALEAFNTALKHDPGHENALSAKSATIVLQSLHGET
ncbi:MAG: TIR domain-containing protein [Pyrinomonadaceae bacterium]